MRCSPAVPHPPSWWRAWFTIVRDGRPWTVIAVCLFGAQVTRFLIGLAVNAVALVATPYGFFGSILCCAGLVCADARSVRMEPKRAAFWAAVVTFGWILGAIPYARRHRHLRRSAAG